MSMISGQIDELRAMAQLEKSLEKPAIARILDDAADTIWQLRDDLQRANAENAKLRKENDTLTRRIDELCMENEQLRQENQSIGMAAYELGRKSMADENAKLRELVGDIWEFGFSNSAGANSVKEWYRVRDELEQRVYAALGAEVDG